jgi:tetratricopeptide (TPR) repeat protein
MNLWKPFCEATMGHDPIGRNAPCYCGSGKKYKFCCLQKSREAKADRTELPSSDRRQNKGRGESSMVVLDLDEGEQLNAEGVQFLERGRFTEAERCFQTAIDAAPLIPAAHNNLALTVFMQGRIDEAIRIQEKIIKRSPINNVFGMSNLVHLFLAAGRLAESNAVADKTLRLEPRDTGALVKQCEAFARLGRHQDILQSVERYAGECNGSVHYFAGMAAANLGIHERALDSLRRVNRRDVYGVRAEKYVRLIKEGRGPDTVEGNWPYFESQDVMPPAVFEKFISESEDGRPDKSSLLRNPVLVDMLAALLNKSRGSGRDDEGIIELLGRVEHPRSAELLKRIAEGTFGSDELRLAAFRTLVSNGAWDKETPRRIWVRGKWTEVKSLQSSVTTEAESAPMPPGLDPLYKEATIAIRRGRWSEGEKLWREFLAQAPAFYPAYHNLAVALIQQGRHAEAETCLRKAIELDPNYIFAPCTLSMLLLGEDRMEEARALLDKVIIPDSVHPAAMATYCSAQCQAAIAEKDIEKAIGWLDMAAKVDPGNQSVKELRKRLRIPRIMEKVFSKMRSRVEKEKIRRRRQVLRRDAPLTECYGMYSTVELSVMAHAIGLDSASLPKGILLSAIGTLLKNTECVRSILRNLLPEEKAALQEVTKAGGRMDYEAFTRAHGSDAGDELDPNKQPQSLLGRLKCRGLLVEATVDRRQSVFIPSRIPLSIDL